LAAAFEAECPILAVFARVGILQPSIGAIPIVVEFKLPPFEIYKAWGAGPHSDKRTYQDLAFSAEIPTSL
jgi:hypothetical protein